MIFKQYKELVAAAVGFRSISTSEEYKPEIEKMVEWLRGIFKDNNFTVLVTLGYGNPIVLAKYTVDEQLPTCIIYGHYDVQPAEISEGWNSDPFELVEKDDRLYARGVVDNKGQVMIHIATIFELIKQNQLCFNVLFMLEGDEETGSAKMKQFVQDHKKDLQADFALLSDGEIGDFPVIDAGFRGGCNVTVSFTTAQQDLHSGVYGTAAPNAAHELTKFLATLYDDNNRVTIPGFYDDVDEVDVAIRQAHESLPFDIEEHKRVTTTKALLVEPDTDLYTQTGLRPTVQVTGVSSGYAGVGYRNSIPATAFAKINFRFVKSQNPERLVAQFKKFVEDSAPEYVDVSVEAHDVHEGIKLDLNGSYTSHVVAAIEKSHAQKPQFKYCGGGLPIVTHFFNELGIQTLSVSLGNADCGMHAANENFRISYINKGLEFSRVFFSTRHTS